MEVNESGVRMPAGNGATNSVVVERRGESMHGPRQLSPSGDRRDTNLDYTSRAADEQIVAGSAELVRFPASA